MKEENTMTTEEKAAAEAQVSEQEQAFIEAQPVADEKAEAVSPQTEAQPAEAAEPKAEAPTNAALPVKFRSVEALVKAYEALEAEFTRRSQRLRALEQANKAPRAQGEPSPVPTACALEQTPSCEAVMNVPSGQNEAEKPLPSSKELTEAFVPLMTHAGAGVMAPAVRPNSFEEAGRLALGYLKKTR